MLSLDPCAKDLLTTASATTLAVTSLLQAISNKSFSSNQSQTPSLAIISHLSLLLITNLFILGLAIIPSTFNPLSPIALVTVKLQPTLP